MGSIGRQKDLEWLLHRFEKAQQVRCDLSVCLAPCCEGRRYCHPYVNLILSREEFE